MSIFKLQIVACNPGNEALVTPPLEALVDTSSELTWLPADDLKRIGVVPQRKQVVSNAAKTEVERAVGCVVLRSNGRQTEDEVVFAEYGDSLILGLRTLEGFGLSPDDTEHRFISIVKFVAFQLHESPGPARRADFLQGNANLKRTVKTERKRPSRARFF
jgi:predicted aspartyl protease